MEKAIRTYIQNSIHNTTAKICEDVAQPPDDIELKEPAPVRRCARLVVIVVAGVLLVSAIVALTIRIPKLQSEKQTFSSSSGMDELVRHVEKLLSDAVNKSQIINCPCQKQVMSWCNVTTFYLYRAETGASITDTMDFTNDDGGDQLQNICSNSKNPVRENICERVLGPVINSEDSRTFLPTASAFMSPDLLYKEITQRIDTNAYEESNAFYFLDVDNKTADYKYSIALTRLLREMQFQFLKNHSSSAHDYWDACKKVRRQFHLKFGYGMEVSWARYLQTCQPQFCDIQFEISGLNRVVRAIGQVGGITTVITLALKFLIWPSLRFALHFPTSKS